MHLWEMLTGFAGRYVTGCRTATLVGPLHVSVDRYTLWILLWAYPRPANKSTALAHISDRQNNVRPREGCVGGLIKITAHPRPEDCDDPPSSSLITGRKSQASKCYQCLLRGPCARSRDRENRYDSELVRSRVGSSVPPV